MRVISRIRNWFVDLFEGEANALKLFLIIAVPVGLIFSISTPLLWGADEMFHISRIYQLSEGHIIADKQLPNRAEGGYGGQIPYNLDVAIQAVVHDMSVSGSTQTSFGYKQVDSPDVYRKIGNLPLEGAETKVRFGFPNTAAYSPLAYAPMVGGMLISRIGHFNIASTVFLLRGISLACFVGVVSLALWILRWSTAKWLVFAIALLPMTLYEGSIITADSLTNAVILLYLAILIKCMLGDKLQKLERVVFAASIIAMPLLKPGYAPILLPLLCIPWRTFARTVREGWVIRITVLGLAVILFGLWTLHTKDVTNYAALIRPDQGYLEVDSHKQLRYILTHPVQYAEVVARLFLIGDTQNVFEMIGSLGTSRIALPGISFVLSTLSLVLGVMMWPTSKISKRIVKALGLGVLVSFLAIITGMYVTYTSFMAPTVAGMQGRYFIPLLLPTVMVAVYGFRATIHKNTEVWVMRDAERWLVGASTVSLIFTAAKFTLVVWG
jgi:uncharacterized membrane protein